MKSITIRDLRQRWPAAESLLQAERELLVTRDGRPVARLVRVAPEERRRPRFDPAQHQRWQAKVFGRQPVTGWADAALAGSRADRELGR